MYFMFELIVLTINNLIGQQFKRFSVTCDAPTDIVVSNSGTDVTIDWEGSAPTYKLIYYVGSGWITAYPSETSFTIPNVAVGTNTIFYLRSICDAEVNFNSPWASASYVTTSGSRTSQDLTFDFEIFPNPTNDVVNVSVENITQSSVNIFIIDAFGKEIYRERFDITSDSNTITLSVSDYAKGVYFLQLVSDDTIRN